MLFSSLLSASSCAPSSSSLFETDAHGSDLWEDIRRQSERRARRVLCDRGSRSDRHGREKRLCSMRTVNVARHSSDGAGMGGVGGLDSRSAAPNELAAGPDLSRPGWLARRGDTGIVVRSARCPAQAQPRDCSYFTTFGEVGGQCQCHALGLLQIKAAGQQLAEEGVKHMHRAQRG